MLKWLINRAPPQHSLLRWALLPMPERLLEISAPAAHALSVDASHTDEFSEIITSLWINQVNKRTARDRLPETLHAVAAALPHGVRELRFLDLGASDGISTYDAVRFFRDERGIPIAACAVDLYTQLHRYDGRWCSEYRTSDGSPVLVRAGRIGLRLGRRLAFWPAERLRTTYLRLQGLRNSLCDVLSIPLVHPLAAADPDVTLVEADALQERSQFRNAFHVVRISNLLNRSYFSQAEMQTIISHAVSYLQDGGVLVVSRNDRNGDGVTERGTVWRRHRDGLEKAADFHGGSELCGLIAQLEQPLVAAPSRIAA